MKLRNGAVLAVFLAPVRVGLSLLRFTETRASRFSSHRDGDLRFVTESRGPAACRATVSERGWLDHRAAVTVSVSRQRARLPISFQPTGNMPLLLHARPSRVTNREQFSALRKAHWRWEPASCSRSPTPTAAGRAKARHHHRVWNSLYRQGLNRNYTFGTGITECHVEFI